MHPQIDPQYFDAQLLERAIESIAALSLAHEKVISIMQNSDFPAHMHAQAQTIKAGYADAMGKLVALRLAVI